MAISKIVTNSVDVGAVALTTQVTGTLPVANGGSGVTTSTGSGAVVLGTSPTLVTPALGTPASGVLTNCTGVAKAALPSGSVLQVVMGSTSTQATATNGTSIDTGLTATITPSSASNKILVMISHGGVFKGNFANSGANFYLVRASTTLTMFGYVVGYTSVVTYVGTTVSTNYLDSPATTSATTYKTQFNSSGGSTDVQRDNAATSTIILMEIAG